MSDPDSAGKKTKPDDVLKAVEAMERVLEYGFGPEDRQLLTGILQTLNKIGDSLDVIQYKLGVEENVWRKFPNSDVKWTFAETPDGKPVEELEEEIEDEVEKEEDKKKKDKKKEKKKKEKKEKKKKKKKKKPKEILWEYVSENPS